MDINSIDTRNQIVAHPVTGILHASFLNGLPNCNTRSTRFVYNMVSAQRVADAADAMFCERCFGANAAQQVRNSVAANHYRVA